MLHMNQKHDRLGVLAVQESNHQKLTKSYEGDKNYDNNIILNTLTPHVNTFLGILTNLTLTKLLQSSYYFYAHFIHEETEALRTSVICPKGGKDKNSEEPNVAEMQETSGR